MAGRFSVETVFKAVDRVTAPVRRIQNSVGKFTRSATRGLRTVNRTLSKTISGMRRLGKYAAVGVTSLTLALSAGAASGVQFEQAITNVGAVALQTREQIAPLEQMALDLGRSTKFTATESANAMEVLARAGFNTNEILQATPAVLSAAAASGLEIADVANHVSNALKGMGLEASEAGRVADILSLASARTNSSIGSLGESLSNAASTARSLGVPIEDLVSSVALLQDVGLDASVAGSAVNVMLTKMAAPSAGIQKRMKQLGLSFKDAKGDMLSFPEVLEQLNEATKRAGGNFDQVAFLAELVGLRGQKAAANLAVLFESGKFSTLSDELRNAEGSAKKMADLRMNTVQGSLLLLGSAVDALKVKIFGLQAGPLKKLIDDLTEWVSVNQDLIAPKVAEWIGSVFRGTQAFFVFLREHGGTVWNVIKSFGALVIVLKTLSVVMGVVNLVMMANPIGLIVVAIAALSLAVAGAIIWWDDLKEAMVGMSDAARAALGMLLGPLATLLDMPALIMANWDPVKDFFKGIGDSVSKVTGAVGDFIFGDSPDSAPARQVVTPEDRIARTLSETRTTNTTEVTLRDETNRAQVTRGRLGNGVTLQPSGAF